METTSSQPNLSLYHCRFCATITDQNQLLDLTQEIPLAKYKEILSFLRLNVDLSEGTSLPKYICLACHNKCFEAYNFFLIVERAQKILSLLYNVNINDSCKYNDDVQYKEHEKCEIKPEIQGNNEGNITKAEIHLKLEIENYHNNEDGQNTEINIEQSSENINLKEEYNSNQSNICYDLPINNEIEIKNMNLSDNVMNNMNIHPQIMNLSDEVTKENNIEFINMNQQPNVGISHSNVSVLPLNYNAENNMLVINTMKCLEWSNTDTYINATNQDINPIPLHIADIVRTNDSTVSLDSINNTSLKDAKPIHYNSVKTVGMRTMNSEASWIQPGCLNTRESLKKLSIDKNSIENVPEQIDLNSLYKNVSKDKSIKDLTGMKVRRIRKEKEINTTDIRWKNDATDNSWVNYPWCCIYCKDEFNSMDDVREHSKHIHDRCFGFNCVDCSDDFNTFNTFVEHARMHRQCLRLYCQYCNEKFDDSAQCHEHSLTHWHAQKICDLCGEAFAEQSALEAHQKTYKRRALSKSIKVRRPKVILHESSLSWQDYEWSCLDCFKVEKDLQSLRHHMKEIHNKCFSTKCADCLLVRLDYHIFVRHVHQHRPYLKHYCQHCNQYFPDPSDLAPHVQRHFAQDRTCYGCGEIFLNDDLLKQHLITYNAPSRKFVPNMTCEICLETFESIPRLKKHQLKHEKKDKSKSVCSVCGKTVQNTSLKAHLRLHSNKSETCAICKKSFSSIIALKAHAKTHIVDRPFICDICGKSFKRKRQVADHLKRHNDVKPFSCSVCQKKFREKCHLKTHSVQHTGLKPFQCGSCDRTFANTSNCNKHMLLKHGASLFKSKITPIGKIGLNDLENIFVDEKAKEWLKDVTSNKRVKKSKA